jgi:hypothetical protein
MAYHLCLFSVVSEERHWCGAFDATSPPNLVGDIGKTADFNIGKAKELVDHAIAIKLK